jgi:hypothetical protein
MHVLLLLLLLLLMRGARARGHGACVGSGKQFFGMTVVYMSLYAC